MWLPALSVQWLPSPDTRQSKYIRNAWRRGNCGRGFPARESLQAPGRIRLPKMPSIGRGSGAASMSASAVSVHSRVRSWSAVPASPVELRGRHGWMDSVLGRQDQRLTFASRAPTVPDASAFTDTFLNDALEADECRKR